MRTAFLDKDTFLMICFYLCVVHNIDSDWSLHISSTAYLLLNIYVIVFLTFIKLKCIIKSQVCCLTLPYEIWADKVTVFMEKNIRSCEIS